MHCSTHDAKKINYFHNNYLKEGEDTSGLLIGCGKKWEILRHFQGKLSGKKGPLCGKLCDFFKGDLICFFRSQRRKPIFLLSNEQLEHKKTIKVSKLNQLLPHFNYFNLK